MSFTFNSRQYMEYIGRAADIIRANGEYVTSLDAVTGDGDHWLNLEKGFTRLVENAAQWGELPIDQCFKQIGLTMMSAVGGSSGILYGSAYIAASRAAQGKQELDSSGLCVCLDAMVQEMMLRGQSQPGYKTMIDALYPAVQAYREGLENNDPDRQILEAVKKAAEEGAQSTLEMPAVRGRACYQADKGVGHLDPGAVTMAYQIGCLCTYICEQLPA